MRRYMVAGNWKLNMGPRAGSALAGAVAERLSDRAGSSAALASACDVLVCPPYVTIPAVVGAVFANRVSVRPVARYRPAAPAPASGEIRPCRLR